MKIKKKTASKCKIYSIMKHERDFIQAYSEEKYLKILQIMDSKISSIFFLNVSQIICILVTLHNLQGSQGMTTTYYQPFLM